MCAGAPPAKQGICYAAMHWGWKERSGGPHMFSRARRWPGLASVALGSGTARSLATGSCLARSELLRDSQLGASTGAEEDAESSSSSSSSSSGSSEASATEEQTLSQSGVHQPFEIDEPCWQHVKSKMLHRAHGDQDACKTKCGRRTSRVYRWMAGAYFKWPRCAVCWKGELLSTRGALADKLNELMRRS